MTQHAALLHPSKDASRQHDLAEELAAEAGELMARRKILLTASAALTTTTSPAAAIRAPGYY